MGVTLKMIVRSRRAQSGATCACTVLSNEDCDCSSVETKSKLNGVVMSEPIISLEAERFRGSKSENPEGMNVVILDYPCLT